MAALFSNEGARLLSFASSPRFMCEVSALWIAFRRAACFCRLYTLRKGRLRISSPRFPRRRHYRERARLKLANGTENAELERQPQEKLQNRVTSAIATFLLTELTPEE